VHDERARTLFDGASLAGWTTTGGRYDGNAAWSVEDGALVGRSGPNGEGGLLYTAREYASFELELETRIDFPFDSGIFLRMRPPESGLRGPQVTLDHRPEGEIAGIYADGWRQHDAQATAGFRAGEWNHVEVRCTGFEPHVDVWLNGEHVTSWALPAGTPGFASTGRIGLQVHDAGAGAGSEQAARFRNVRLRELPMFPSVAELRDLGSWTPLFDGTNLDAWESAGPAEGYVVRDGVLGIAAHGGAGHLYTKADFEDFCLRLDFQLSFMANSGLFLRAARDGTNPAYSGCEIQILDDFDWERVTGDTLRDWQLCGSLYGAVPPGDRSALRPPGEWNTYELLCRGTRLALALNGRVLWDVADTHALAVDPPFSARAARGFIGLQRYGGADVRDEVEIRFRDVYVEPLR
jgi:hypothetical protein